MNCNLVITNNYGDLLDDIKELSTKIWLLLEKGQAYQFNLSLIDLALSFPSMGIKSRLNVFFVISRKYGSL